MLWTELLAALEEETGLRRSRAWISELCTRLDIQTRGRVGRRQTLSPEQRKTNDLRRWQRWYKGVKGDPVRIEEYRRKHRRS
jgi:hypothetical protein